MDMCKGCKFYLSFWCWSIKTEKSTTKDLKTERKV